MKDALGLTLEDTDLLQQAPSIVMYGNPGVGKSTAIAAAFSDALFLLSTPNVLRPYVSWYAVEKAKNPKLQALPPEKLARKVVQDTQTLQVKYPNLTCWDAFTTILTRFEQAAYKGTNPYPGIVIDEWSAILTAVFADMKASSKFKTPAGKTDGFRLIDELKGLQRRVCKVAERTGKYVVMVCHAAQPTYHAADDESLALDKRGTLKYIGGPNLPIGTLIESTTAAADFVLHLTVESNIMEEKAKRILLSEADPLWARKARDFRVPPKVDFAEYDLRKLLAQAEVKT